MQLQLEVGVVAADGQRPQQHGRRVGDAADPPRREADREVHGIDAPDGAQLDVLGGDPLGGEPGVAQRHLVTEEVREQRRLARDERRQAARMRLRDVDAGLGRRRRTRSSGEGPPRSRASARSRSRSGSAMCMTLTPTSDSPSSPGVTDAAGPSSSSPTTAFPSARHTHATLCALRALAHADGPSFAGLPPPAGRCPRETRRADQRFLPSRARARAVSRAGRATAVRRRTRTAMMGG